MNAIEKDFRETMVNNDLGEGIIDKQAVAETLAGRVERFVKWIFFGVHQFYPSENNGIDGEHEVYNSEDHTNYTLPELYRYWLDNVDGK